MLGGRLVSWEQESQFPQAIKITRHDKFISEMIYINWI